MKRNPSGRWIVEALRGQVLVLVLVAAPADAEDVRLATDGAIETVYAWKSSGCAEDFIPDSPARAFRRPDGSVVLMAAHYTNSIFVGPSLDRLSPRCATRSGGRERAEPERFDDRFWVQALHPLPNGRVMALVSHEYMGKRHPGRCERAEKPGPQCWYSSILEATAGDADFRFTLPALDRRVVAASPLRFDPAREARSGFLTTTNIVAAGEWLYVASWAEFPGTRGNCLFRTRATAPEGPWLAWKDGVFGERFSDPYAGAPHSAGCDPIGANRQFGILRSIVWLERHRTFVGVFSVANGTGRTPGIYYALSDDLLRWGEARLLTPLRPWFGTLDCEAFYDYPSLIDTLSPSQTFATAADAIDLYLTRFNWMSCQRGLNRDLVRVRVVVTPPT